MRWSINKVGRPGFRMLMIPTSMKKRVPSTIKHPLRACTQWYWDMRGLPAQSLKDISIFKDLLSHAGNSTIRVLEWGSGKSTVFYPKFLMSTGRDFEWYAIENSKRWHAKSREKLLQNGLADRVHVEVFEFPAFWELPGYTVHEPIPPHSYTSDPNVARYIGWPAELGLQFDLVIVDGRFRRRCLLAAPDFLAPEGVVILHDAHKAHYHSSLSAYPYVQFLETGKLPGTSVQSMIALCSLSDNPCIQRFRPNNDPAA